VAEDASCLDRLKRHLAESGRTLVDFDVEPDRTKWCVEARAWAFMCDEIDRLDREHAELRRRLDNLEGDGK
jgi:hypothetical protein